MSARRLLPLVVGVALAGPACRKSLPEGEAPRERLLAEAMTPVGGVRLVCVVEKSRTVGLNLPRGGCEHVLWARADAAGAAPTELARGPGFQDCAAEWKLCAEDEGHVAAKAGPGKELVAALASRHAGQHVVYVVPDAARALRLDGTASSVESELAQAPALEDLVSERLTKKRPPPRGLHLEHEDDVDGLWEIVGQPARLQRHLAEVEARVRACTAPRTILPDFVAARGPEGHRALYEAAKRPLCDVARQQLVAAKPREIEPLLLADLASDAGALPLDRWLYELTAALAPKAAARPLEARMGALLYRPDDDGVLEAHGVWFVAARAMAAVEPARATKLLVARLREVPRARTESKFPGAAFDVTDGYGPNTALYVARLLLELDSPELRKDLVAILGDEAQSPASRTMALVLLEVWAAPHPEAKGIVLGPLQDSGVREARAKTAR